MNLIFRYAAGLAWDAAEAVGEWLNCNRAADQLWTQQHTDAAARLAEAEAEAEVSEPVIGRCDSIGSMNGLPCRCVLDTEHAATHRFYRNQSSSTVGEAPNPTVEDAPQQSPTLPAAAGHPILTKAEVLRAAAAVRAHVIGGLPAIDPEFWNVLADRLDEVGSAMK